MMEEMPTTQADHKQFNYDKDSRYELDPSYNLSDPDAPKALSNRERIFQQIDKERIRQNSKWGEQNHDGAKWSLIALEEFGEVANAILEHDGKNYLVELIQTASVLVSWLECEMRRLNEAGINFEEFIDSQ